MRLEMRLFLTVQWGEGRAVGASTQDGWYPEDFREDELQFFEKENLVE